MRFQNLFYLLAITALAGLVYSDSIGVANYTYSQANGIIANATAYVNLINSSSYLIFSPDLSLSYKYLNDAAGVYQTSPSAAVEYAYKAESAAMGQYNIIQGYKNSSIYLIIALALASLAILYVLMKPVKIQTKKNG